MPVEPGTGDSRMSIADNAASELAVDWKARALAAEAERDRLREALERIDTGASHAISVSPTSRDLEDFRLVAEIARAALSPSVGLGGKGSSRASLPAHASPLRSAAATDTPCDLESQIDHWLDDAIAQEFPPGGWCGRVAKHIADGIKSEDR